MTDAAARLTLERRLLRLDGQKRLADLAQLRAGARGRHLGQARAHDARATNADELGK